VQNLSHIAIQFIICDLKRQHLWWTSNWSYSNNITHEFSNKLIITLMTINIGVFICGLNWYFLISSFDIVIFFIFHNFSMPSNIFMSFIKQCGMLSVAQFWLCHLKSNLWNGSPRNLGGNTLTSSFPSNLFNCSFMLEEMWVYVFTPNSMCSCSYVMGWTSIYGMVLGSFLAL
jgi:hypothetical protein